MSAPLGVYKKIPMHVHDMEPRLCHPLEKINKCDKVVTFYEVTINKEGEEEDTRVEKGQGEEHCAHDDVGRTADRNTAEMRIRCAT